MGPNTRNSFNSEFISFTLEKSKSQKFCAKFTEFGDKVPQSILKFPPQEKLKKLKNFDRMDIFWFSKINQELGPIQLCSPVLILLHLISIFIKICLS